RELDHLNRNANAIGTHVVRVLTTNNPPQAMQALIENYSFLSQARVRVMGLDGQTIAESGTPSDFLISLTYSQAIPESDSDSDVIFFQQVDREEQRIEGPNPPPETWESPIGTRVETTQYLPMISVISDRSPWWTARAFSESVPGQQGALFD